MAHGDARGAFKRLAVPGQTRFARDEALELAALASYDIGDANAPGAVRASRRLTSTIRSRSQPKRFSQPTTPHQETPNDDVQQAAVREEAPERQLDGAVQQQLPEPRGSTGEASERGDVELLKLQLEHGVFLPSDAR